MKKIVWSIATLLIGFCATAQGVDKKPVVDFTANVQTNHLWRGLIVTDKPMVGVQTIFNIDGENHFTAGFWGGMSVSNESDGTHYKEIDYFVQYANNGFSIGLWDLFNTRGVKSPGIWNYKENETGHILDLRTSYNFGKDFPLTIEADVLLYGAVDRELDGTETKQRYSTYLQVSAPLYNGAKVHLDGFVGAGFALNGETHLYGNGENKFDVVNIGLTASKTLKLGSLKLPVSATTLWNLSLKVARIQLAATLF